MTVEWRASIQGVYRFLFWLVLRRLPAEFVHTLSLGLLRFLAAIPPVAALLRAWCRPPAALWVRALGRDFPSPLGLAAGFDKDGTAVAGLAALGFGFIEVGTVTAQPQPGNPKPRLFRLPADQAIINRMGFNNAGATAVAARLRRLRDTWPANPDRPRPIVGVNIGRNKEVAAAATIENYVAAAREVAAVADYVAVNVSSPNTPGLRSLQTVAELGPLLGAVRRALDEAAPQTDARVPLLVKIAPDLSDADIGAIARLAAGGLVDGIIATNTTLSRADLQTPSEVVAACGPGGLSGAPLAGRALAVLRLLRAQLGPDFPLIAVGGIMTPADVAARLAAGATLVQGYTGLVYGGPFWAKKSNKYLLRAEYS